MNKLVYIGQTTWTCKKRWSSHKKCARMLINHRSGKKLLKSEYKFVLSSALYTAMADIGIEFFTCDMVIEVPDEDLNETEKYYVEIHNCISPNGYNLTSGGGSKYQHALESIEKMKVAKRKNINNVRNPLLHDMPPLFTYDSSLEAILLQKHPLCAFKGFYVRTYGTIEATKDAAKKFVADLEESGKQHERPRKLKNSPAKGVYEIPEGSGKYYVTKCVKKITYRKAFSDGTPEENKRKAIEYVTNLLATH